MGSWRSSGGKAAAPLRRGDGAAAPLRRGDGAAAPLRRGDSGQATVEVAVLLPILAILAIGLLQVGLVVRAKVLTVHAAREAARAASVGDDPHAAAATSGLNPLTVQVSSDGSQVTVVITYVDPTDLPIIGAAMPSVSLQSEATMRVEDWPKP